MFYRGERNKEEEKARERREEKRREEMEKKRTEEKRKGDEGLEKEKRYSSE